MASAKVEGSGFSDRNPDAPRADEAAGESGVSATSAVSPAASNRELILAAKETAVVLAEIIRAANGKPADSPALVRLFRAIKDAENEPRRA